MKMEQTECSETSAHEIWTPGHHPEERTQPFYFSFHMSLRMTLKRHAVPSEYAFETGFS
jgi:hypothetical protein